MGFFLETLLGGLMAGMLYSLVALGFVLIFKASGVFNFAQGAMVLFAALAMARFAEWIPQWTGIDNKIMANVAAFAIAAVIMFIVAWVIERLVLRHLVNQEGATLLMAWAKLFLAAIFTRSTLACPKSRSWHFKARSKAAF
jgi:branched-chain amino acid transport system permease protein